MHSKQIKYKYKKLLHHKCLCFWHSVSPKSVLRKLTKQEPDSSVISSVLAWLKLDGWSESWHLTLTVPHHITQPPHLKRRGLKPTMELICLFDSAAAVCLCGWRHFDGFVPHSLLQKHLKTINNALEKFFWDYLCWCAWDIGDRWE